MRIIITPLGDDFVKGLKEDKETLLTTRTERGRNKPKRDFSNEKHENYTERIDTKESHRSKIQKHKKDLMNKLEMDQTTISVEDLSTAKEIHVKLKKVNIPKNVTERYNAVGKTSIILPNVTIPKKENNNTINTSHIKRSKHTIKEILNADTLKTLKTKYVSDKKMRDKLFIFDERNFRTYYQDKNYVDQLNDRLERKINPDRINLINYLHVKEKVSDVLIKRIAEFDEEKINRANKICQIVSHNEERGKLFKEVIKERLKSKQTRDKVDYKVKIENMGNDLLGINEILKEYAKSLNKREKYRDIHNDLQKTHWKKYNVDDITRRVNINIHTSNVNTSLNTHAKHFFSQFEKKPTNHSLENSQIL